MCPSNQIRHGAVFMMNIPRNSNNKHMQAGYRPVVTISNNFNLSTSPCIHVLPLTTKFTKAKLPTHVLLKSDFLTKSSICLVEQLMQVSKQNLIETGKYIGTLSAEELAEVKEAVKLQLNIA